MEAEANAAHEEEGESSALEIGLFRPATGLWKMKIFKLPSRIFLIVTSLVRIQSSRYRTPLQSISRRPRWGHMCDTHERKVFGRALRRWDRWARYS